MTDVPTYLTDYADLWRRSPHEANLAWFRDAGAGLFLHYGLYSQLGRGEWVMYQEAIRPSEYEKLFDTFNPERFDADFITDLVLQAGMKYVNLTACHHEGFCLYDSPGEPFNSVAACGRDLVAELAAACERKGVGLFIYFTYAINWRHPHAMPRRTMDHARPDYAGGDPRYEATDDAQSGPLWQWSLDRIEELCRLPYPVAGIWLDIVMAYYLAPELVPVAETYESIRRLRPEMLISYKQGATGEEDFAAPEHSACSLADRLREKGREDGAEIADRAWRANRHKHNEICMTLQTNRTWGYHAESPHQSADALWSSLANARARNCNLLVNTGPAPDGSIHPDDVATLQAVGRRIACEGPPSSDEGVEPGPEQEKDTKHE